MFGSDCLDNQNQKFSDGEPNPHWLQGHFLRFLPVSGSSLFFWRGSVPTYYYFLKEPPGKALNFFTKIQNLCFKVNVFFKIMGVLGY